MNDTLMKILYFLVTSCGLLILFAIYNSAQEARKLNKNKDTISYSQKNIKNMCIIFGMEKNILKLIVSNLEYFLQVKL